jgi:hypothetical protein
MDMGHYNAIESREEESRGNDSMTIKRTRVKSKNARLLTNGELILHLLKGNIGAGALSLPYAFAKCGLEVAPALYLLVVQ